MGSARAPQAHVPRRPAGSENGQGLLRVRRAGEAQDIDDLALDTKKAAVWGTLAGAATIGALAFGPGFFPAWYFLLVAAGYGLILPLIAILHVRHTSMRASGAVLGTIAGTATVTVGIAASGNEALVVAALFVRGMWWWTIGKLWWETSIVPVRFAIPTMVLAVLTFVAAIASAPMAMDARSLFTIERAVLGVWLLATSYALWRLR